MIELIIEAFSADKIIELGFSVLRHPNAIHFNYNYSIHGSKDNLREAATQPQATLLDLLTASSQPELPEKASVDDLFEQLFALDDGL